MRILLLGNGGREHTLAWKISQSPQCTTLFIAPGNAGTAEIGQNVFLDISNFETIRQFIFEHDIQMVVVGPEAPLVSGIYDFLKAEPQLPDLIVIGPSKEAAKLEGSKDFAKIFMKEFGIPTASYQSFNGASIGEGLAYIEKMTPPIVLKADGLAGGKGVLICETIKEAKSALQQMLDGQFGAASQTVVIEEFLKGIEFSVFVLTDGKHWITLPEAKDYKRIGEGDTGLNTGGMGAVSPVPFVDEALMQQVEKEIIEPTINGLQQRKLTYKGFIFFGLIAVNNKPYVIEYNCRLGDPETQVVLPRLKSDLVGLFKTLHEGKLDEAKVEVDPRTALSIVLAAEGYPVKYQKGKIIRIPTILSSKSLIFHAGTRRAEEDLLTDGGRILNLTSLAGSIGAARAESLKMAESVMFEGKYYRKDIGKDLL